MKIDPNVVLADLTSVDKMLDAIKASEQAKTALTSELATANEALEALKAETEQKTASVEALEARVSELTNELAQANEAKEEAANKVSELEAERASADVEATAVDTQIATAVEAALEAQKAEHEVAVSAITAELAAAKSAYEALVAQVEEAKAASEAVEAQLNTVADVLEVKGVISDTTNQSADVNSAAALVARYEALANSIYPHQKAEARKIYAQHKAEIVAFLDSKTGTKSNPVEKQATPSISEEQWALYNSWLADRETLTSKVSRLTEEQRTTLHVKNRRTYSANKELFDRCFAARSVKEN